MAESFGGVRVPVDDRIDVGKRSPQPAMKPCLGPPIAQGDRPDERGRLFVEVAAVAVKKTDPPAADFNHPSIRKWQRRVVVALDRLHRGDPAQFGEGFHGAHVAGVEDQVDAVQQLGEAGREALQELRAVGVCHDPDPDLPRAHPIILPAARAITICQPDLTKWKDIVSNWHVQDTKRGILAKVAQGTLTPEEAALELQALDPEVALRAAEPDATPPSDLARVRVVTSMGSVTVVGDESVREAVADGPHQARREGDTLVVESLYGDGSGFHFGRMTFGFDVQEPRLLVRMNPALALDVQVQAGTVRIQGIRSPIRAEVQAGSTKIEGFSGPIYLDCQAGSVRARGRLTGGSSKINCQAGSVKLDLEPDSSVKITARTSLGKISLLGAPTVAGIGTGTAHAELGAGAGTLDIVAEMGSVQVGVGL